MSNVTLIDRTADSRQPIRPSSQLDANNPWPGLDSFTEGAELFFNGRERETEVLLSRVLRSPVTVLFGTSGLGKTSLLRAGLFPKLRRKHILPIYIRLDFSEAAAPPMAQVKLAFQNELKAQHIDSSPFLDGETLWEYLHRKELDLWSKDNWQVTPLLVFDQFEEIHTVGAQNAEAIKQLRTDLADLIENRIPAELNQRLEAMGDDVILYKNYAFRAQRIKILLSFREDFLADFEAWNREIPSFLRNRVRLEPMKEAQAVRAIYETGKINNLVSKEIAEQIVQMIGRNSSELSAGESTASAGGEALLRVRTSVEPTILSLFCRDLNEARKQSGKAAIDQSLLTARKPQTIVEDFYDSATQDLPDNVKRFLEGELLVTRHGYRKQCAKDDALNTKVSEDSLKLLVDRRLLQRIPRDGVDWYELTHDLLTNVIKRRRGVRAAEERRLAHEKEILHLEEQKRLEERARGASRLRVLLVVMMILMGVAVFAANEALNASRRAEENRIKAVIALDEVKNQKRIVEVAAERAKQQQQIAENKAIEAEHQKRLAEINANKAKRQEQLAIASEMNARLQQSMAETSTNKAKRLQRVAEKAKSELTQKNIKLKSAYSEIKTQKDRADYSAQLAYSRELAAYATMSFDSDPAIGFRLAEESVKTSEKLAELSAIDSELTEKPVNSLFKKVEYLARKTIWDFYQRPWFEPASYLNGIGKAIKFLTFSPDDSRIVMISKDNKAAVWNTGTGELVSILDRQTGPLTSAVFSYDAQRLLTTSTDNITRIWDAQTGSELVSLRGNDEAILSATLSPDGKRVITLSPDSTVRYWNAKSGREIGDGQVLLKDVSIISAAISSDGRLLYAATKDGRILLNILNSGKIKFTSLNDYQFKKAAFSPESGLLVTTSFNDDAARVYNVNPLLEGKDVKFVTLLEGHGGEIQTVSFSQNGDAIVTTSSDKIARVWDARSGARLAALGDSNYKITTAALSRDGDHIITASQVDGARIWFRESSTSLAKFTKHKKAAFSSAFSPDGLRVVSASADNTARVWDWKNHRQIAVLKGHKDTVNFATFSPDGMRILTASDDKTARLWDARTGATLAVLRGHSKGVNKAVFSIDGTKIITASADKTVRIWDALHDFASLKVLQGFSGGVTTVAFAHKGASFFTASDSKPISIMQWDQNLNPRTVAVANRGKMVNSGAFSTDGKLIVSALSDNTAQVWNTDNGKIVTILKGHTDWINASAISPDGQRIVTGSSDKTVRLWDANTGKMLAIFADYEGPVTSVSFSSDGKYIVSSSADKSVRVWPGSYETVLSLVNKQKIRGQVTQLSCADKERFDIKDKDTMVACK